MVDVSKNSRVLWHGKWIWAAYVTPRRIGHADKPAEYAGIRSDEMNAFVLMRKQFSVGTGLEKAIINITADSRYKLFVNGKYIGRGINRCEAYYWYYNVYDITNALKEGDNIIAISARFYGQEFAYYNLPELAGRNRENCGKGGILFDIELKYKNESGETSDWIGSDNACKIVRNPGERSDMPLKNDALGFLEEVDYRKIPKNWNELGFDDTKWETPLILDYPIKTLVFDENAPLHEELHHPVEALFVGETEDANFMEEFDEEDLAEMDFNIQHQVEGMPELLKSFEIINMDAIFGKGGHCEIKSKDPNKSKGRTCYLFMRFEKEMVGYPQIIVEGTEGTIVDIIPTEKMADNMPALDFLGQKRGSRLVMRDGKQFFEQWDWEGFFYMLIKIRNLTNALKIYQIATNQTHMRVSQKGKFDCEDKDLVKLWETCAYTLLCCAIDGYLDCPSREQRSYLGDAYPEMMIANACFGEPRLTKKLIYDTALGQRKDGITFSFHPGDYQIQCHIIPDYCFYWIQIAHDYELYYGDEQTIAELFPHFVRAIDWFWKYINPTTGLLDNVPYWIFLDWSFRHDKPGINAIFNTQFMDVLLIVANYAEKYCAGRTCERYRLQAEIMRKAIDKTFWDEKESCYRDYLLDGKLFGYSQATNAYLVIKGVAPKAKWERIMKRIFDDPPDENDKKQIDELMLKNLSHHSFNIDAKDQILVAQPFFMHHINKFFGMMDRFDLMIKYFKRGWVPMLTLGPTQTIWETWAKQGSECHAWSATPAYDLSTYWLGIQPLSPGFKSVLISPTFYGLHSVEGEFPTCKGKIYVKWDKKAIKDQIHVDLTLNLPEYILEGVVRLRPLEQQKVTQLLMNKKPLKANTLEIRIGPGETILEITY